MILLFTHICKYLLNKSENFSNERLFQDATDRFNYRGKNCPKCRALGRLMSYGGYFRRLISRKEDEITDSLIYTLRFKCKSCNSTHALLPDVLIPYSRYSLRFKLLALIAYFERKTTVVNICESFNIAVSTLYEWKKQLLLHKDLLIGLLLSQKTTGLDFIRTFLNTESTPNPLERFFNKHGFSFLRKRGLATHTVPP